MLLSLLLPLLACHRDSGELRRPPPGLAIASTLGGTNPTTPPPTTDPPATDTDTDTGAPTVDTGPPPPTGTTGALLGYIGSPCTTDADCPYTGGECLADALGFPGGHCSAACDQFCDDLAGYPTTFCATIDALPATVAWLGDGGCVSRCDFGAYPYDGCREGYGCVAAERANDPGAETWVCLPNVASDLPSCMDDLAARGVPFSPTILADDHPVDAPDLTCHVEDPIVFQSGYLGVDLIYDFGSPASVTGACSLGQALADTIEDVTAQVPDVVAIHHLGTYNCRTIAGTSTLSRHGYGDAIDLSAFDLADGATYVVESDWEIDDATPEGAGGAWLYDAAHRWHDDLLWTIILTPDYNAAHYNHFHVDLTPGSDFLGFTGPGYLGPSPWPDE